MGLVVTVGPRPRSSQPAGTLHTEGVCASGVGVDGAAAASRICDSGDAVLTAELEVAGGLSQGRVRGPPYSFKLQR